MNAPATAPVFLLPSTGFIRERRLLDVVGFSSATLWRRAKEGSFPKPLRLGPKMTAWRLEDVHAWLARAQDANVPARPRPTPKGRPTNPKSASTPAPSTRPPVPVQTQRRSQRSARA